MEALLISLGTLLVVAGYMIVKRMARSNCAINSGCLQCDSPAVELAKQHTELAKKHTERLDELFEMIKQITPQQGPVSPISLTPDHFAIDRPTTSEGKRESSS